MSHKNNEESFINEDNITSHGHLDKTNSMELEEEVRVNNNEYDVRRKTVNP